jgi:hypothetical protein
LTTKRTRTTRPLRSSPHYRTFIATTRRSAPLPRIGTLPLAVPAAWGSPFRRPRQHVIDHIEASGSQVPHRSLNRARATSAPDTTWPGMQAPARLIPGQQLDPGFGCRRYAFDVSSVVHSRSPSRLPPDAITGAFSATLTTPAHSPTQLAVVCDLPLRGRSRRAHLHHRCSTASNAPSSTPEPPSAFLAHRRRRSGSAEHLAARVAAGLVWSSGARRGARRARSGRCWPAAATARPQRNGQLLLRGHAELPAAGTALACQWDIVTCRVV